MQGVTALLAPLRIRRRAALRRQIYTARRQRRGDTGANARERGNTRPDCGPRGEKADDGRRWLYGERFRVETVASLTTPSSSP